MTRIALVAICCIGGAMIAGADVNAAAGPLPVAEAGAAADDGFVLHLPYVQRGWHVYPVDPKHYGWRYLSPTNEANDIAVDRRTGLVWAATDGGLIRWDPATGRGVRHRTQPTNRVAVDSQGNVWTAGGQLKGLLDDTSILGRFDTTGSWRRYTFDDGFATGGLTDIVAGSRGEVWFGFRTMSLESERDGGLTRLGPGGGVTTYGIADGWPTQDVIGLADDRKGGVWVTLAGGRDDDPWQVGHVDDAGRATWTPLAELGLPRSFVAAVDVDGSVFARTTGIGLGPDTPRVYRRDPESGWAPFALPDGSTLDHMAVHQIAIDDDGTKWFVGYLQLLRLSRDGTWSEYPDDPATAVPNDPMALEQRALAFGASSVSGGVAFGADGDTWFASAGRHGGVTSFDRDGHWRVLADPDGWWPHTVGALVLDHDDRAWLVDQPWVNGSPRGSLYRAETGHAMERLDPRHERNGATHPAPLAVDGQGWPA